MVICRPVAHAPCVTVLLPVRDGEAYLREAVDSILRQTWRDFELLVIDDGSTDRSAEIVSAYTDPRELVDAINKGEVYRYLVKPWESADLRQEEKQNLAAVFAVFALIVLPILVIQIAAMINGLQEVVTTQTPSLWLTAMPRRRSIALMAITRSRRSCKAQPV